MDTLFRHIVKTRKPLIFQQGIFVIYATRKLNITGELRTFRKENKSTKLLNATTYSNRDK